MNYWQPPRMWDGGTCWIIGGGASMPRQFGIPEEVINGVEQGKKPLTVYSTYLKELHDKNVIGTNVAFLFGHWISVLCFSDASFYQNYVTKILQFKNLKITCLNSIERNLKPTTTNLKRMKQDNRPGLSSVPDTVCWNYNSGGMAIDLAAKFGVKRILLLGFDMKPINNRTHWHTGMPNYLKPTSNISFQRFLRTFEVISQDAKQRGIEILNVNEDSAINEFKKVRLQDVL